MGTPDELQESFGPSGPDEGLQGLGTPQSLSKDFSGLSSRLFRPFQELVETFSKGSGLWISDLEDMQESSSLSGLAKQAVEAQGQRSLMQQLLVVRCLQHEKSAKIRMALTPEESPHPNVLGYHPTLITHTPPPPQFDVSRCHPQILRGALYMRENGTICPFGLFPSLVAF